MDLSTILRGNAVKNIAATSSKKRLFQELGEIAASAYDLDAGEVCVALQEREALGPTGVGKGVALPHARLPGLTKVLGIFIKLEKTLEFGAVDRQPIDLVFCLLAPEDAGVDHLKALALVSRTMRDGNLCSKLRANSDENTLHTMLTEAPKSQAA